MDFALTGPPQSRPSGFVGKGGRDGAGGVLAEGGDGTERNPFRRGWDGWTRTSECGSQSPVPYHLATPHRCDPP